MLRTLMEHLPDTMLSAKRMLISFLTNWPPVLGRTNWKS